MKRALTGFLVVLVAGCGSPPAAPGREKAIFPDLPAPEGFSYEDGYGHVETAFRTYTQTYLGQRRLDDTVKWYKAAFPASQWSLVSETPGDPTTLTFVKKAEQAVVTVAGDAKAGLKIVVKVDKKSG